MNTESDESDLRSSKARWIPTVVAVALLASVIFLATRPAADDARSASPLVGQTAPPIAGATLDGKFVDLAAHRGRFVVVNFFASWCVPCRQEHPELIRFAERHQGATAPAIIAVAYDRNDLDAARNFFAQEGGTWPVLAENGSGVAVSYGVRGLPESFVVNPDGSIAAHITGKVTAAGLDSLTGGLA